jgi:hypothetical protein
MNTYMSAQGMTIYWPSRDSETNQRKVTYIDGPIEADIAYTFVEDLGFVGKKGDLNTDEVVDVLDIINSVNFVLGGDTPDPEILWAADMNFDTILNILDVVRLVNFILA